MQMWNTNTMCHQIVLKLYGLVSNKRGEKKSLMIIYISNAASFSGRLYYVWKGKELLATEMSKKETFAPFVLDHTTFLAPFFS